MVKPNLLNAILVEFKQINRKDTVWDDKKKQPSGVIVWEKPFKTNAQIYFGKDKYWSAATATPDPRSMGGIVQESDGYVIVRKFDLQSVGKELKTGDIISGYGRTGENVKCELLLIGMKNAAHYADMGQCTLERWYFRERNG
jgi:hypothetical protein